MISNNLEPTLLGKIASFEMGQAPPGNECNKEGRGTLFVKAGEFGPLYPVEREWTTKPLKFGKHGDVFICVVGATCGKLNLGVDCAIGRSVAAIRPKNGIESKFIYYQILPQVERIRSTSAGSAQGVISKSDLSDIPVVFAPSEDQERIVAEIEKQFSRLDESVIALKRIQANLKRYKASVLKAAVEGVESKWWQPIESAIETIGQGWSPQCDRESSPDTETWGVIKTTAVQPKTFLEGENKRLPEKLQPRPALEILQNDILITRAGPRSRVGVACLVRSSRPRLMVCDKVYRLRCQEKVVRPDYLELVLNAPVIVDSLDELKTGISDSGVNLTQVRFNKLAIPLPPIKEQKVIVEEVERLLSVTEELEATIETNLKRAERLRQTILQQAFSGQL